MRVLLGNLASVTLGSLSRLHEAVALLNSPLSTTAARGAVSNIQRLDGIINTLAQSVENPEEKNFLLTISQNINQLLKPLLVSVKSHLTNRNPETRGEFESHYVNIVSIISMLNKNSIPPFSSYSQITIMQREPSRMGTITEENMEQYVPTKFCAISGKPIYPGMEFLFFKEKCYLPEYFKCAGTGELIGERQFVHVDNQFYLREYYELVKNLYCSGTGVSLLGKPYITFKGKNYEEEYFRKTYPHVNIRYEDQ